MKEYQLHPLAELAPELGDDELQQLVDSIRENGQQVPAIIFDGMLLDGRHRQRACRSLGIELSVREVDGDPSALVIALNARRRHMTKAQISMMVAAALKPGDAAKPGRRKDAEKGATTTIDDRAQIAGVSRSTQAESERVVRANPVLAKEVIAGTATMADASASVTTTKPPKKAPMEGLGSDEESAMIAERENRGAEEQAEARALADMERAHLIEENTALTDRLAVKAMDATEEERQLAEQTIAELRGRVAELENELEVLQVAHRESMRENSDLKRSLASYKRNAIAAKKAVTK